MRYTEENEIALKAARDLSQLPLLLVSVPKSFCFFLALQASIMFCRVCFCRVSFLYGVLAIAGVSYLATSANAVGIPSVAGISAGFPTVIVLPDFKVFLSDSGEALQSQLGWNWPKHWAWQRPERSDLLQQRG